jgi:hypothetical protein
MPARWVPLLYFAFAHACLATAFAALAFEARSLAGFFYHPRMLAVVHLATLGWISASILGAVYVIGPLAFRMPLPARRADYVAFAGFAIGVVGMSGHFWIDRPLGTAWATGLVAAAMLHVAARGLAGLRSAPVPWEARLPMALAFVNMVLAVALGVLAAIHKVAPFARVFQLDLVFAHAHLAALGWGAMMVVGAGYRMLPMILPAAMPRGAAAYASALLLEAGTLGLAVSFLTGGRGLTLAAGLAVAGLAAFLSRVVWMLRHRRPGPTELRRPDWGTAHALQALICLLAACGLGLYLSVAERSEATLALASVYGVLGLVGFLSQIVVGVESRILPLFAWLWGFADRAHAEMPPSLHTASLRPVQALIFFLWAVGVPLLAFGLGTDRIASLRLGTAALLAAVLAGFANTVIVLLRLWHKPAIPSASS